MFKKITSVLLFVGVILTTSSLFAAKAGTYDDVFKTATFGELYTYTESELSTYQMRGFAASPDGKYLFGGFLQSNRCVWKFAAEDGGSIESYKDAEPGYAKGLAVDDRGYLYCGMANDANNGLVRFTIVDYATMSEVALEEIEIEGKVGVNGTAVAKVGDKYYLYLVTNYGPNYIICYDVTDPTKPVVNTGFGDNGRADIKALLSNTDAEGNYIAVDSDGYVYLTAKSGSGKKGDTVYKISPDGKMLDKIHNVVEAYGICVYDEYVLVTSYNSADSCVFVLNKSDLSDVCQIGKIDNNTDLYYTGIALVNNTIYIADQNYDSGDKIIVSNVLAIPEKTEGDTSAETPATEEPADETETENTDTNPVTSDLSVVMYVLAGLSGCGMFTALKRKR